jgi:hypothetical protein
MKVKFDEYIKEGNEPEKKPQTLSLETFMEILKKTYMRDFSRSVAQTDEFVKLYQDHFSECWANGYTVREAIASTRRGGIRIDNKANNEAIMFDIDGDFEFFNSALNEITEPVQLKIANQMIEDYYNKYKHQVISDERIFDRIRNNYSTLLKTYEEKKKEYRNDDEV